MSSEFLKSNPMALHHCLLYEFLQNKNIDESYGYFCRKVGKDVIDLDEFKILFDRFSERKFDNGEVSDLKMVLQKDKEAVRACILYESMELAPEEEKPKIEKKEKNFSEIWGMNDLLEAMTPKKFIDPIFDSYKKMCGILGDDVIGYQEYYAYYQKFTRKEFDLEDIDKNDKKPLTLSDMPMDVIKVLGQKLEYLDRCALRKVSRNLRDFCDVSNFRQDSFSLCSSDDVSMTTRISDKAHMFAPEIRYSQNGINCHVAYGENQKEIEGSNHLELALNDMKILFENPKFQLGHWKLSLKTLQNAEAFHVAFSSIDYKLHVESIDVSGYFIDPALKILPLFKPGVLQNIHFQTRFYWISDDLEAIQKFESIMKMDQWKQAKSFKMHIFPSFPIENLYHFDTICVGFSELNMDDVRKVINVLFNKPSFKSAHFCYINAKKINNQTLREEFGIPTEKEDSNIYHYQNPITKELFEIELTLYDNPDSLMECTTGNTIEFSRK